MKTGYSTTKRFVPTWKGNDKLEAANQMIAVFTMPSTGEVFEVLDNLQQIGIKAKGNSDDVGIGQAAQIAKQTRDFLPNYVKLDNAEDFDMTTVLNDPRYFQLAVELLFALIAFAQPSEEDAKN